ncbi:MAG TPA: hypothetical protein VH914_22170 [Acidimicrobiia bacterium]|nr:hypothetical protein [Acidimicrobiia bacterium]
MPSSASSPRTPTRQWFTSRTRTELAVLVSAFEIWTHTDDIRRAIGRPLDTPSAAALHTMAVGSTTMVPSALAASGRDRAGRTARIELTGPGGGTWTVPMRVGGDVGTPDVAITLSAVEWCRRSASGSSRTSSTSRSKAIVGSPTISSARHASSRGSDRPDRAPGESAGFDLRAPAPTRAAKG